MNKPSDTIVESIAPSRDVSGLPISDGYAVRNVVGAELRDTLRLPRGDAHESTLVAVRKYYDGANGGEAGHYAMLFVEFRAERSRWRTAGVKIRAEEAERIARDTLKGKPSKPGRGESSRVGGKTIATNESELRAVPVDGGKGYLIHVRHKNPAGEWARTRGVELRQSEWPAVAGLLKQLAATPKGV